ncbi:MAG: ABC transporter substrate-binding protein [Nocardioides sp.]|uniref:ABC transporter substrate-binding protein n=1 Tax=Nocardioides sp. TaxID=35761 RepID=UPI0039E66400
MTESGFNDYNPWGSGNGINGTLWSNEALYDSLTRLDADGNVEPAVATSWKQSADGKTTTLKLRSGISFDDGTALDATAVKKNLDYGIAHPEGAECNAYLAGATTKVNSATSITITTPEPVPGLLQDFAQCAGFMVNPKSLGSKSLTTSSDGSGPYTIDKSQTVSGTKWTYVKRDDYWDSKAFPYQKIVFTVFNDSTAADNAAKSGQVDLIQRVDAKDDSSGFTLGSSDPDTYVGLYISDADGKIVPALGNTKVRQAMNYAIDRDAIKKAFYGDFADVIGSTPFSKSYTGYSSSLDDYYTYDVDKAKQLLKQAGYADGFTVKVLVDPTHQKLVQAIAGYLEAVGIKLDLSVHSTDFITQMLSGKWAMVSGNYTLNPAQYQTLTGILGPNGFWNPQHVKNPKFTSLLNKIVKTTDESQLTKLYGQLATTAASEAWTINPMLAYSPVAYDSDKLSVGLTSGVPVPMIYNITPK